jgi:hypothetical protein
MRPRMNFVPYNEAWFGCPVLGVGSRGGPGFQKPDICDLF